MAIAWSGSALAEESSLGSAGARGARWQQGTVTVSVEDSVDLLGDPAYEAVIAAATEWQESPGLLPTVVVTRGPEDPIGYRRSGKNRNTVRFSPDGDPLANGALAITVITFDAQAKQILDADIVLNGEHDFDFFEGEQTEPGSRYDLQNVLTHEFGHFFGLGEEFKDEEATMYAFSQPGEVGKRDLEPLDEVNISDLYDAPFIPEESSGCGGATIAGYDGEAWSWAAFGLALLGLVVRRRAYRTGLLGFFGIAFGFALAPARDGSLPTAADGTARELTVLSAQSHWEDGLIVTELGLHDRGTGQEHRARVLGGQVEGIAQQVGRVLPPPVGASVAFPEQCLQAHFCLAVVPEEAP